MVHGELHEFQTLSAFPTSLKQLLGVRGWTQHWKEEPGVRGPNPMALSRSWRGGTQMGKITQGANGDDAASVWTAKEATGGHGRPFCLLCVHHTGEWLYSAPLEQDRLGHNSDSWTISEARNTNIFLEPSSCSLSPHLCLTPAFFCYGAKQLCPEFPQLSVNPKRQNTQKVDSSRKRSRLEQSPPDYLLKGHEVIKSGAGELARQLGALVEFTKDLNSTPSSHMAAHNQGV